MDKLIKSAGDKITSLEIAEITGKRHDNILRDIRNMEKAWVELGQLKFEVTSYSDSQSRIRECFSLSKTECLYIATKFNDVARARLVLRWEELEEMVSAASSIPAELRKYGDRKVQVDSSKSVKRFLNENGMSVKDYFKDSIKYHTGTTKDGVRAIARAEGVDVDNNNSCRDWIRELDPGTGAGIAVTDEMVVAGAEHKKAADITTKHFIPGFQAMDELGVLEAVIGKKQISTH
jgi:Rha family phage regulatory protein